MAQRYTKNLDTMRKTEISHARLVSKKYAVHKAHARQNTLKKKAKTSKSFKIKV